MHYGSGSHHFHYCHVYKSGGYLITLGLSLFSINLPSDQVATAFDNVTFRPPDVSEKSGGYLITSGLSLFFTHVHSGSGSHHLKFLKKWWLPDHVGTLSISRALRSGSHHFCSLGHLALDGQEWWPPDCRGDSVHFPAACLPAGEPAGPDGSPTEPRLNHRGFSRGPVRPPAARGPAAGRRRPSPAITSTHHRARLSPWPGARPFCRLDPGPSAARGSDTPGPRAAPRAPGRQRLGWLDTLGLGRGCMHELACEICSLWAQ